MMQTRPSGHALDIGGSWARLYRFDDAEVVWTARMEQVGPGPARIEAIISLLRESRASLGALPTACAGAKDAERSEVVLSHFGAPMLGLCASVRESMGVWLGPLLDDDVCAGWGHVASPRGALQVGAPNTLLLTGGTGVAENLWIGGEMVPKGSYRRASELGLEAALRAEGWRDPDTAEKALGSLVEARRRDYPLDRVVLSGRLAELPQVRPDRLSQRLGLLVEASSLPEAPALGALLLASREAVADTPRAL